MGPECSNELLELACWPVEVSNLFPFRPVFSVPFIRPLTISSILLITLQTAAVGQSDLAEKTTRFPTSVSSEKLTRSRVPLIATEESDSLLIKRSFFFTTVSQQGKRLSGRSIIEQMEDIPQAQTLYLRGQVLKPVGPLLIASSLVVGYIAVKGTQKTAYARGIGTPANPSPPDVLVEYTSRSLPTLIGSIGLLVSGLCLIEIANGTTAKSINLYNAQVTPGRSVSTQKTLNLGLTTSGRLGAEVSF